MAVSRTALAALWLSLALHSCSSAVMVWTGAGIGRVAGGGRLATVSPSVWYLPGTSDSTAWGDVYNWEMRSCANISEAAWERVLGGEFCMVRSQQPAAV